MAGSEIVDAQVDVEGLEPRECRPRRLQIVDQARLADLQLETLGASTR